MVFTVHGRGPFPMTMLRSDECWPATDDDAAKIAGSFAEGAGRWAVTLWSHKRGAPTIGRWDSFNCRAALADSE